MAQPGALRRPLEAQALFALEIAVRENKRKLSKSQDHPFQLKYLRVP